jgi:hypothetical protein
MFCNDLGDRGGKMGVKTVISFITAPLFLSPLSKITQILTPSSF